MTGGQLSPTMAIGDKATTATHGNVERPFDLCRLVEAAGATFVARGTAANIRQTETFIKKGIQHPGFAFIEAVVPCPTEYGRRQGMKNVVKMLDDEKDRTVTKLKASKMAPAELVNKIVTGILYEEKNVPEFQRTYADSAHALTRAATEKAPIPEEEK
jgi:2-oxoglutarate ferredoxin oxidoreductase subunit beta